jgi:hypothetical protein
MLDFGKPPGPMFMLGLGAPGAKTRLRGVMARFYINPSVGVQILESETVPSGTKGMRRVSLEDIRSLLTTKT